MTGSRHRSPNIVLIMSDQHRADMMGCAGDPSVITPSLDRLAAEGVRFSRTSCQGPLCMPARASFMTERYVRDHGVYTNWAEIGEDTPTYVWALREAGYHTAMLGKAHLYRDEIVQASHIDELAPKLQALGFTEVQETGDKFLPAIPTRYSDYLQSRGLLQAYKDHIAARSYQGDNESGQNATKTVPMWDATPMPVPLESYVDEWHGTRAVEWIEGYDRAEPFFLFVGFPGPHDPWDAPKEAVDRYRDVEISMPRTTARPVLDGTGRYQDLLNSFLWVSDSESMSDDAIRTMRTAYAADVTVIDAAVGRIMAALSAKGVLQDTWVIYTSDHGEMAGWHGLMSKCVLYDGAVRVPLIVRPPDGTDPVVVDGRVEHVDVPATVRAIAGAPDLPGSEGRSLLGHLTGEVPTPKDFSVSENWGFGAFETDRYKIVVDEDDVVACQLFDLAEDPHEDHNLVADPQAKAVLDELMDGVVRPFLATPPARPHRSLFTGPPWDDTSAT
ncbi:MAG TPA: sulfatase-like hydrolase/transferase [Acidimicrobiales bacterium]|nr:sulfatase-like hydrolase/transferase [Acidimicrobiales bacterium]